MEVSTFEHIKYAMRNIVSQKHCDKPKRKNYFRNYVKIHPGVK